MDPNESKITYKCLTKPSSTRAHTVHIKNRFNKLTLSSSNKKIKPPSVRTLCQDTSSAPKMLNYSSDDSTFTSDDDEIYPKTAANPQGVNCLLVSSSGTSAEPEKYRVSELIPPCEAPTFSQRLEVSDADETNCSLMDQERIPSIYAADTLIDARTANEVTLGTQMEKLQITVESEDLFDDPESSGHSHGKPLKNDEVIAVAQNRIINTLSQGLEKLELDEQLNRTVLTISSSSSIPPAAAQLSTRSSLESEEVYDVITLSDSDIASSQQGEIPGPTDVSNQDRSEPPSQERNMSPLNSQTIMPIATDLSEMALDRLDRFFDNIPLLSSGTPNPTPTDNQSTNQTLSEAAESVVSQVYISETDEENTVDEEKKDSVLSVNEKDVDENDQQKDGLVIESPIRKTQNENINLQSEDKNTETPIPRVLSVRSTESTQTNKTKKSSKSSNRTPVVNISAKFQIRIQVATPNDSSSECSSSHQSSSGRFSTNSPKPNTPLDKVTNRISEMCIISDSNSEHGSAHTPKSKPRKLQLDKLKTPRPPKVNVEEAETPKTPPKSQSPIKILSEADQRLLNELYGVSWQTPEVLKKCKLLKTGATETKTSGGNTISKPLTSKNIRNKENFIDKNVQGASADDHHDFSKNSHDFSMFRKNIANHLDSTRIDEVVSGPPIQAKKDVSHVGSPFFHKQPVEVMSPTPKQIKLATPLNLNESNDSPIRSVRKKKINLIADSDSDDQSNKSIAEIQITKGRSVRKCKAKISNKNFEITEDESNNSNSASSENEWQLENPSKSKKGSKRSEEITYLDLTQYEVIVEEDHQAPNASDQDLEVLSQKLLQPFEYKKPDQFVFQTPVSVAAIDKPTPTPKSTKRKLFTPYFDDMQQASEIYKQHDITPPNNTRQTLMNVMSQSLRDGPESEVKFRHGLPKFLQPTNRRIEDLQRAEKAIPESPKSGEAAKKPATPRSQRKNKGDASTLPTCVNDIPATPDNKYGFLRSFDVEISKNLMHPTALMFRDMFKTKKMELANLLYDMYNERVFKGSLVVPITWNKKLQTTAGYCYSRRSGGIRTAAIDLSDKVITSADRLRCTLIHELCHAATWIVNADRGHGATWKEWARRANATFPDLPPIERCHAYDIEYKYTYQCTLCTAKSHAHSRSKKVELIRCAYCHGAIEIFINKKNKDGAVCPTPVRKASGFAAFVKVAYKDFKLPGVAHADVMRQLSAKFATLSADEKKKY